VNGERPIWQERAKCRGRDPALFFPGVGQHVLGAKAKAVCRGEDGASMCPVIEECGDYGQQVGERQGIWGGCSEKDWRWVQWVVRRRRARVSIL
jgi:Transcription factor WhiB